MGPVGRVPSNFGEPCDQVYLVPCNFVTAIFCWARRVTFETLQLFISRSDLQEKLLDLRYWGIMDAEREWAQQQRGI